MNIPRVFKISILIILLIGLIISSFLNIFYFQKIKIMKGNEKIKDSMFYNVSDSLEWYRMKYNKEYLKFPILETNKN